MVDPTETPFTRALIQEALATLKWKQKNLSDAVGVSGALLSYYLVGTRGLSTATLARILEALEAALEADQDRLVLEFQAKIDARIELRKALSTRPHITSALAAWLRVRAMQALDREDVAEGVSAPNSEEVTAE